MQNCILWQADRGVTRMGSWLVHRDLLTHSLPPPPLPRWGTWMDGCGDGWRDGRMERRTGDVRHPPQQDKTYDIIYRDVIISICFHMNFANWDNVASFWYYSKVWKRFCWFFFFNGGRHEGSKRNLNFQRPHGIIFNTFKVNLNVTNQSSM